MTTSYSYGKDFFVKEALFTRGRITGVIGPNGSGKTTLLKTIAGMMPYRGSIMIDDRECRSYGGMERAKKVSYLPQTVKAVSLDVETLVWHGRFPWHGNYRKLTEDDARIIDESLQTATVQDLRKRDLTELSGGELRRAYVAMMFAQNADMMLLDEPTTYMDIKSQSMLYEILRQYAGSGHGVIMTCHGIDQAFSYCDDIVVMNERTLVKCISPGRLKEDEASLRSIFGVSVKRSDDAGLVYPYQLVK
ncbi:MAG: ABC transporter ATP-binding protein [Lachnospiraceae bacterium]|nr:ABC transporter ATP-binding protein [Lachnospiraceae bacterium]